MFANLQLRRLERPIIIYDDKDARSELRWKNKTKNRTSWLLLFSRPRKDGRAVFSFIRFFKTRFGHLKYIIL